MTDSPASQPRPASEELHWGISYLREDIQDLRNQVGVVHHRIDETNRSLSEQIQDLRNQIGAVHHRIDETNKRMDAYFRWTMTTLVAITGILIAVIKL